MLQTLLILILGGTLKLSGSASRVDFTSSDAGIYAKCLTTNTPAWVFASPSVIDSHMLVDTSITVLDVTCESMSFRSRRPGLPLSGKPRTRSSGIRLHARERRDTESGAWSTLERIRLVLVTRPSLQRQRTRVARIRGPPVCAVPCLPGRAKNEL